jgi:hypothetical protein
LLVVAAIQGLTPDLHDLASSRAMILLCPDLADDNAFQVEDESADDVCEVMESFRTRAKLRQADPLPPTGFTIPVASPLSPPTLGAGPAHCRGVASHSPSLHHGLCRLIC